MKLCVDCKHYFKGMVGFQDSNSCFRGKTSFDIVTGISKIEKLSCHDERSAGKIWAKLLGMCGKEGRFFVKREEDKT